MLENAYGFYKFSLKICFKYAYFVALFTQILFLFYRYYGGFGTSTTIFIFWVL